MPTFFLDIDGTLLKHRGDMTNNLNDPPIMDIVDKNDVQRFFEKLYLMDAKIIIVTGRKESMRRSTEAALVSLGVQYDELIMGCPRGPRIIVNDRKPATGLPTAAAVNVDRNQFTWTNIFPTDIVSETDYGWRIMIDYHKDTVIFKTKIDPGKVMHTENEPAPGLWSIVSGEITATYINGASSVFSAPSPVKRPYDLCSLHNFSTEPVYLIEIIRFSV